ncbi:MAG: efflux RND transporter periplasmic adaptor subunit [Lentisphaeria bacterium]|nr:efflux RND transporter periplasmic adaptor subunit [Lentisphaeria bacterium]
MKHPSSFLFLAAGLLCLVACSKPGENDGAQAGTVYKVKVQTAQAQQRHFRKQIRVQGTIQAYIFTNIAARAAGNMELKVDDGDTIKKGQTLFLIDQDNLKNRVAMAEQALKVVEETYRSTQLDIGIAETQLEKAQKDFDRNRMLHEGHAVSDNAFETYEVALDKAKKSYEKAEAALRNDAAKVDLVKLELEIAKKNLSDATEKAPYDGVVAVKYRENGEFVGAGVSIIRINDPKKLRASCLISAVYSDAVKPGETPVIVSFHDKKIEAKADWCSPVIDPLSRTFTMRANLPEGTPLKDGMLVDVDITLAERDGTGVPRDAVILKKGGRSAVFAVHDGRAQEIEVTTGITSDGYIEILNPEVVAGRNLIVSGQYFVNDGSEVNVTNAN